MHIVVCVNHIPDPEAPAKQFKLDERTGKPLVERFSKVIGPFDENALEVALQLRETAGAKLTALTVGPATSQEALRRALALRYDAAVHVKEDRAVDLDSAGVARVLAAAIRKLGDVDLVMCGRQVGDWDGGQVGLLLAEDLRFTCVSLAHKVESAGGGSIQLIQESQGGMAVVEAQLPALLTVTNSPGNQLRIPKVKDAMAAHRMPITTWTGADLGVDVAALAQEPRMVVRRLSIPDTSVEVELIGGESPEEVAEKLAKRILGLKVI